MNIIELLKQKQLESKLNNAEFGKLYGISETYWSHLKNGTKKCGIAFLENVLRVNKRNVRVQRAIIQYLIESSSTPEEVIE